MDPDFARLEFPRFNPEEKDTVTEQNKAAEAAPSPGIPWIGNGFGLFNSPVLPADPKKPAELAADPNAAAPDKGKPAGKPKGTKPVVVNVFTSKPKGEKPAKEGEKK